MIKRSKKKCLFVGVEERREVVEEREEEEEVAEEVKENKGKK